MRARSAAIADALQAHLTGERHRFITLTIRSNTEPLALLLEKLTDAFRRLQRSNLWRQTVKGGIGFLEVKRFPERRRWHPHLHLIVHGSYVPQRALARLWQQITGDSYIVDVRAVKQVREAVQYVTKYATKTVDQATVREHDALVEAIDALKGKRSMMTFGDWRRIKLRRTQEPDDYEPVCNLGTLLEHCRRGESWALHVWSNLSRRDDATETPRHSSRASPASVLD